MKEQTEILLQDERAGADAPGFLTRLGKITRMWLTDDGELGIETDLAYNLGIKFTQADIDQLRGLLIEEEAEK